jgi:SAM-dependent methyltransferase
MAGASQFPTDGRRFAPATQRNRDPILAQLRRFLPERGTVLEIASGTGEHATYFAPQLPGLRWQPSDPDPELRLSIAAWCAHLATANVLPPLDLDVERVPWPVTQADAVVNINMIHISPWSATGALMRGARLVLPPGGVLYLYGPFQRDHQHTAPSNQDFDQGLRRMNPAWGVRDLDEVTAVAAEQGLLRVEIVPMPANNLSVLFRRSE